ncbi:MAG: aminotransferase class IV, partial [Phycisphaerales bacterium]|nr:aminotransferase class IV [Phycisphaerales bacterium]
MTQNIYSNINGQLILTHETDIKSTDEAVRSHYGLYESILYRRGQLELQDLHWERLWSGLSVLGFQRPAHWNAAFFAAHIEDLVRANQLTDIARVRLQIYSDEVQAPLQPLYYIEAMAIESPTTQWNEIGLKIAVLPDFRKPMMPESNCKISHSRHYPIAKAMMEAQDLDDVLLLNTEGNIIESAIANIFWVKEGVFYTPPLSDGCLAGTMRIWLLQQMKAQQIPHQEQSVDLNALLVADELFCSNSIRFIRWVQ